MVQVLVACNNPQDLVSFVLPGANYLGETFTDLQAQSREIQADVMYNVVPEILRRLLLELFRSQNKDEADRTNLNAFQGVEDEGEDS